MISGKTNNRCELKIAFEKLTTRRRRRRCVWEAIEEKCVNRNETHCGTRAIIKMREKKTFCFCLVIMDTTRQTHSFIHKPVGARGGDGNKKRLNPHRQSDDITWRQMWSGLDNPASLNHTESLLFPKHIQIGFFFWIVQSNLLACRVTRLPPLGWCGVSHRRNSLTFLFLSHVESPLFIFVQWKKLTTITKRNVIHHGLRAKERRAHSTENENRVILIMFQFDP